MKNGNEKEGVEEKKNNPEIDRLAFVATPIDFFCISMPVPIIYFLLCVGRKSEEKKG